jgi:hypothetical protein
MPVVESERGDWWCEARRLSVRELIKKLLPLSVRNFLMPYYCRLTQARRDRRERVLRGRNWTMDLSVPETMRPDFLDSALMGRLDLDVETDKLNVLLCALPKSASLYLVQLLSLTLSLDNHQIGFNEAGGDVYYPRLLAAKFVEGNTISHCHAEAVRGTVQMIKALHLRPLILTRNLLDALMSRRDMLVRDRWAGQLLSANGISRFVDGTDEYQLDVTIDLFADTYINFVAGWEQFRGDAELRPVFMTYQEMLDDEPGLVMRVATELGLDVSADRVRRLSAEIRKAGGINFSTGVAGRGRSMLTDRHISQLRRKAQMLGCTDELFLGFEL